MLAPPVIRSDRKIDPPAGFDWHKKIVSSGRQPLAPELDELKVKKAWEVAYAPAKAIPMNLIMSYMTGNSLQMIPIMMTLMLLWNPLKAIFTETNASFRSLRTEGNAADILLTKGVFVICQLASMLVGVWKLNKMGLIPNSEADWLAWRSPDVPVEKLLVL